MSEAVTRRAWDELPSHLEEQGFDLVEVEYKQEGGRWVLRVYVDKPGGVTLDDCAAVSQLLSPALDAADFIEQSYCLEVSSPGVDRPVRKPEDFRRYIGERMKLRTAAPVSGRRRFKGELTDFRDGLIVLDCDGATFEIHVENLEKANLDR